MDALMNETTKIKICGIFRPDDVDAVNEVLPDYIGFVFAKSKRQVTPLQAAALKGSLNQSIKVVGVFVNASIEEIAELCREKVIDVVQLHGNEDAEYITYLKKRIACPTIKAVRVNNAEDILNAERLPADFLLLDTYHKESLGGTGESFDWSIIPKLSKPYFLAGGLCAENLLSAAKQGAYCLDVSSGAETNGIKDSSKIRRLVQLIKGVKV